jgi:hypothetical protein
MSYAMQPQPRLSIVVPMTTDTQSLEETLVSVLENRPDDAEIIVVLARPYADPWNIRDEVRFMKAPAGAGLVACVNLGIAASRAPVIHVLAAGWRATSGWTDAPLAILEAGEAGAVAPMAASNGRAVASGVRYGGGGRRRCHASNPMSPSLDVGFWRADVLEKAGRGFTLTCGDHYADADMAVTLDRMGCPVVTEPSSRVVRGEPRRPGNPFLAGLHAERLFWRSLVGQAFLPALFLHCLEIIRHAAARAPLGMVPMLAGRAVAMLQFGTYRERCRQLLDLMGEADGEADDQRTIRIDAAHAPVARPVVADRERAAPLRRSA